MEEKYFIIFSDNMFARNFYQVMFASWLKLSVKVIYLHLNSILIIEFLCNGV